MTSNEQDILYKAAVAMRDFGGGFHKALARCIFAADRKNKQRIFETWEQDVFQYLFMLAQSNGPSDETRRQLLEHGYCPLCGQALNQDTGVCQDCGVAPKLEDYGG